MIVKINGYEINTAEKHVAAQGFWYIATKGAKKYFLKQYNPARPIPPSEGGGSEKVYEKNLKAFEKRVEYRTRINGTIRSFSSSGGNIVAPMEEFVFQLPDESGKNLYFYWEATELIPGVISDDDLETSIKNLRDKDRFLVIATAAAALHTLHQHGIVHSDLKLGNVLLAKNTSGNIVTKLIDFDGSYFMDDKDTLIAGDEVYCSPELLQFYDEEDDDSEFRARLNEKSDIFSLGLIYHFYLSGHLPVGVDLPEFLRKQQEKGRPVHCSEVLLHGGKLEISDKILSLKYRLLIQDMLQIDPSKRPSAIQVLTRVKEPELDFSVEDPWPEHSIVLKVDNIRTADYVILRKITVDGIKKYELISKRAKTSIVSKEELVSSGLAELLRENKWDEPWPEHNISFDIDKVKSKKFVSIERAIINSTKGYYLYSHDNSKRFLPVDKMLFFGFAYTKKKDATPPAGFTACEPWPEHNIIFNADALMAKGFVRSERAEINGKKGYNLYTASNTKRFILLEMLKVMGLVQNN